MWLGYVITFLFGLSMILAFSWATCKALKININLEKAVNDETLFNQSSYKLKRTIDGSVALRIKSPNFSILSIA